EDPTPPELAKSVSQVMCTRRLRVDNANETGDALTQAGYLRLKLEAWLKCPQVQPATELLAKYDDALSQSGPPGSPENVLILDPNRPVKYYRGRWTALKNQTGRFLARRSQAYGSQLWCYLEAIDGRVTRLLDLPQFEKRWNPFDE